VFIPATARAYAAPGHNRLLDCLPAADRDFLMPSLRCRAFTVNDIFIRRDRSITHVYFPTTCIASVVTQLDSGETVETGTIGNEGFVGIPVLLDADSTPNEVICQHDGDALAVPVTAFRELLERSPAARSLLGRYTQSFLVQSSQSTACNRLHTISHRCAKWLLMTHDRSGSETFHLTQEFLAVMLGARRASVSVAAAALQRAGVIAYRRGIVTILDRPALEAAACECYRVTREEYDRLIA
jgi:CRP-like cAMP-binding protein